MGRRQYTDEQREEALDLYREHGPTEAARLLGPDGPAKSTIREWAKAANVRTVRTAKTREATEARSVDLAELRSRLQHRLLVAAHTEMDLLEDVSKPSQRRDTWVAIGIAIDKHLAVMAHGDGDGETPSWLKHAATEIRRLREVRAE